MRPAALGGMLIGAVIAILVLSMLFEWALFKRVMDDPVYGKGSSVFAAWVAAVGLYSLSDYPNAYGYMCYTAAAIFIAPFKFRRGMRLRAEQEDPAEEFSKVFE